MGVQWFWFHVVWKHWQMCKCNTMEISVFLWLPCILWCDSRKLLLIRSWMGNRLTRIKLGVMVENQLSKRDIFSSVHLRKCKPKPLPETPQKEWGELFPANSQSLSNGNVKKNIWDFFAHSTCWPTSESPLLSGITKLPNPFPPSPFQKTRNRTILLWLICLWVWAELHFPTAAKSWASMDGT